MDIQEKIQSQLEQYDEFLLDVYKSTIQQTRVALHTCDSPLERLFLLTYLNQYCYEVQISVNTDSPVREEFGRFCFTYGFWDFALGRAGSETYFCLVQGQKPLTIDGREYRVDFFFELVADIGIVRTKRKMLARVAVELDGHDFHERTKEQAERDRSRDRAFTKEGIRVLRFTGREVYRDADAVVREVHRLLKSFISDEPVESSPGC